MSRRRSTLAIVAVACATGLLAALAPPAHAAGHFTLAGSHVHVYNLAGSVEVATGTGPSVTVESTTGGKDRVQILVQTLPGAEPALVFKYPGNKIVYRLDSRLFGSSTTSLQGGADGRFGEGWGKNGLGLGRREVEIRSSGSGLEAWADLRIAIPRGQCAAIHLGVGGVTVANVDGELLIDCAAAGVDEQGTKGALRVDTGSGAVTVEAPATLDATIHLETGRVILETGSGRIRLVKA